VIAPRSADTATQPIAVEDVVEYLLAASRLEHPLNAGRRDRRPRADNVRQSHA
jgi:hypothetical protein